MCRFYLLICEEHKIYVHIRQRRSSPCSILRWKTSKIRKKVSKNILLENQKKHINKFKTEKDSFEDEDSYINKILLTKESDSNKYENNVDIENREMKKDKRKKDIGTLCKPLKILNQKHFIIKVNQGNIILNNEQKEIADNYFNYNKNKYINCMNEGKINSIPIQKYKENKTLFTEKYPLIDNNRYNSNIYKFYNNLKNSKKSIKVKSKIPKKIPYTKETINKNNRKREFPSKTKNENNEIDNSSLLQDCTNESYDLSFLGSSLNDDFYHNIYC